MEGSVRGQGVIGVVMGVGKGREQGGQENQQLAHPSKVWGGLKHVGAECAQWRVVQKNWLWFSRGCEAARPRGGASQRRGIRRKCWRRQRQHKWQLSRVVRQPGGPIPTCACTLPSRRTVATACSVAGAQQSQSWTGGRLGSVRPESKGSCAQVLSEDVKCVMYVYYVNGP